MAVPVCGEGEGVTLGVACVLRASSALYGHSDRGRPRGVTVSALTALRWTVGYLFVLGFRLLSCRVNCRGSVVIFWVKLGKLFNGVRPRSW